jgi:nucleoid-associated protein YgaU
MLTARKIFLAPLLAAALAGGATIATAQQAAVAAEPPVTARGGEAELEQLTEQVIQSLQALQGQQEEPRPTAEADLYRTLNSLVEKALAEGKTSEDVIQLIEEALGRRGDVSLEQLLAGGGRKVDLRQLLRELVARAAARAEAPGDAYTRALMEEGAATTLDMAATRTAGVARAAVPAAAGTAEAKTAGGRMITVQPGDTLGTLARRYYGDAALWRRIYEANRDRISNPDLLLAGQRIRIP